jgi:lysylphosphatidylglycerol synthetase-like protein (DUF2156 family)
MFAILIAPIINTFAAACGKPTFLGIFRPWYQYLTIATDPAGNCSISNFSNKSSNQILGAHSPFLLIALAILDDLIRAAALVAVGFVIYGGIQYVASQGSPDATKRAQQTIINALIGVVIAVIAASIVAWLGGQLA